MADDEIKLSYIPSQFRVRCEFYRRHCLESPEPPDHLIKRARDKLDSEKEKNNIRFYRFYDTRLKTIWERMRQSKEDDDHPMAVTLAAGAPVMHGLHIEPLIQHEPVIARLTLGAPQETIAAWDHRAIKMTIGKTLRDCGITKIADPTQIHATWLRAAAGVKMVHEPIRELPKWNVSEGDERPYILRATKDGRQMTVEVHNVQNLLQPEVWQRLTRTITARARDHAKSAKGRYKLLYDDTISQLRSAMRGPERYGVDMPLVLLVGLAIDPEHAAGRDPLVTVPKQLKPLSTLKEQKPISIETKVAEDKMKAWITGLDLGDFSANDVTDAILEQELRAKGIVFGIDGETIAQVVSMAQAQEPIEETLVAKGNEGEPGSQPYLQRPKKSNQVKGDEKVLLREIQMRKYVREDELIAKIHYKHPPTPRIDVYGNESEVEGNEELDVKICDRVERRGDEFYALYDGRPRIDGNKIKLEPSLVHRGNVDLASGNIHFEGDVKIQGSIEKGTTVEARGDLIVDKSIRGGDVICEGDLTVKGGIVQGHSGRLIVKGNLTATFIENSEVIVSGDVVVERSIIGSHLSVGGDVIVLDVGSLVLGGHIRCYGNLECGIMGRDGGVSTKVDVGCDWRNLDAYDHRLARIGKVKIVQESDKTKLDTLRKRLPSQLSRKDFLLKKELTARVKKLNELIAKMESNLNKFKTMLQHVQTSRLEVAEGLSPNTEIRIAGKPARFESQLASVMIRRGKEGNPEVLKLPPKERKAS